MENSLVILNWNMEISILRLSLDNAINEFDEIIFVDNGSSNQMCVKKMLQDYPTVKGVLNKSNTGFTKGKNIGIRQSKGKYVFLLNSDIVYVPGTLATYKAILDREECANIGMFDLEPGASGTMGTQELDKADKYIDLKMLKEDYKCRNPRKFYGVRVSWLHYGLYSGDILRNILLPEEYPFDRPGHGYEDDWHYYQMKELGYTSICVNFPLYYHDQTTSKQALADEDNKVSSDERRVAFENKWGEKNWFHNTQDIYGSDI